ncbi:hypothetical protein ACFCX4_32570 [Kitasatospora sp. NPDC056327]|uniref:hypothetical protein n=1 Tax=Kitasatospora sp. NPDC056327 TaxID=3345785 RepID=UPI0035DC92B7
MTTRAPTASAAVPVVGAHYRHRRDTARRLTPAPAPRTSTVPGCPVPGPAGPAADPGSRSGGAS